MDADMDNLATEQKYWYDGSEDGLSDKQTSILKHIYLHPDLVWLYYQKYGATYTEVLTIWVTTIYNKDYAPVSLIERGIIIINLSTPQT